MPETAEKAEKTGKARSRVVDGIDCTGLLTNLGQHIRAKRQERGWNQTELARALGVEQHAVSQWENGQVDVSICRVAHIAEVLQMPLTHLLPAEPGTPSLPNDSAYFVAHRIKSMLGTLAAAREMPGMSGFAQRLEEEIVAELKRTEHNGAGKK